MVGEWMLTSANMLPMYHSLKGGLRGVGNFGDSAKGRYRSTISQSLGLRGPTGLKGCQSKNI